MTGRVSAFDLHRGLGTVVGDDGRSYSFHCVAIADGSRTIEVGAAVRFVVTAGLLGVDQATDLHPA